jgi:AcrR family transcriptional regulator
MEEKSRVILEQVGKLYRRYGIKSVTMDDVARELGISKKTLYQHFRDKEDLVRKVMLNEYERHRCVLSGSTAGRPQNAIEELFGVYTMTSAMLRDFNPSMGYDLRKYYPRLFVQIRDRWRKRILASALDNLNKGKKEGLYRKELNSRIIARLHVSRAESLLDNDLFTPEELASMKMFHEVFVYHLNGILSHKGRTFFEKHFDQFKSSLQATY